jgi:hypothetical protein
MNSTDAYSNTQACPFCNEKISTSSLVCQHCNTKLIGNKDFAKCRKCRKPVPINSLSMKKSVCPHCGAKGSSAVGTSTNNKVVLFVVGGLSLCFAAALFDIIPMVGGVMGLLGVVAIAQGLFLGKMNNDFIN